MTATELFLTRTTPSSIKVTYEVNAHAGIACDMFDYYSAYIMHACRIRTTFTSCGDTVTTYLYHYLSLCLLVTLVNRQSQSQLIFSSKAK